MLEKFYITFGQQYRHEAHPSGLAIHPDGYVVIEAIDCFAARSKAFEMFGNHFCMLHTQGTWFNENHEQFYPLGELFI
jgi:hypothetical protein